MAVRIGSVKAGEPIPIDCVGGLLISPRDAGSDSPAWATGAPVEIRASKRGWSVKGKPAGTASSQREFPPCELVVVAREGAPRTLEWNHVKWPGELRLVEVSSDGGLDGAGTSPRRIDLVMDIAMESYLPGVIAKELYGGWDKETYRAQAIAARSFAFVERDRWAGRRHYDLVAGQQSQAWEGETKNQRAIDAVAATRGQMLVVDGRVVPAYYSSACGGHPASALGTLTDNPFHSIAAVSAGDAGKRVGACCQGASVASWKVTIPRSAVRSRLQAWGKVNGRPDLAAIEMPSAIEINERNAAGRAISFTLTAGKHSYEIGAEDLRWAMNAPRDRKTTLKSGDLAAKFVRVDGAASVEFSGRGFGHGVGLCQHGAQEMAKSGATAQEILARYYLGATIERAWK